VAHDARGKELWGIVLAGEAVRRAARLASELAKDGVRVFVVSDDAVYSVSGTAMRSTAKQRGGQLPRSLADESVAPKVVQQLDGALAEGTRNMEECQYGVPT
jgi:hypothetical protein